jgi:hypothetical protein
MKKHILGIALFSLIIGSAGIFYSFFADDYDTYNIVETEVYSYESFDGGFVESQPIIRQAVLDLKTKQINWEFSNRNNKADIALYFYIVDSHGVRYLNSEHTRTTNDFVSSYIWLDNLKSYENLYVIAVDMNTHRAQSAIPRFEINKATSVLLYSGKQGYLAEKYNKE